MNDKSIYEPADPTSAFRTEGYPEQQQPYPGIQGKMDPVPDCGEHSYKGADRLKGRKALVTGADSGIGRAAAIAFAREGADVALNYHPDEEQDAREVKKIIEQAGRKAVMLPGKLEDEQFNTEMVRKAHQELGGLDILALVAGRQIALESIEEISTQQLREVFAINVFSMFWTVKAALPLLSEGASIITTSSIEAYDPSDNLIDYSTTKGAIKTFTIALAAQLASKGIRVNCVAPGPVWTALQVSGGQFREDLPEFGKSVPLKRAGQPVELSGVYVHLASQESSFTTGQIYGVTGGKPL